MGIGQRMQKIKSTPWGPCFAEDFILIGRPSVEPGKCRGPSRISLVNNSSLVF